MIPMTPSLQMQYVKWFRRWYVCMCLRLQCIGLWRYTQTCPLTLEQEFSLDAAGIDISHPSQLKKHEWGLVCAQLTVFSVEMLPMLTIKTCSHKIFKLLKASDGKCETPSSDNNGGEAHYALCRSVATIVRVLLCMQTPCLNNLKFESVTPY